MKLFGVSERKSAPRVKDDAGSVELQPWPIKLPFPNSYDLWPSMDNWVYVNKVELTQQM